MPINSIPDRDTSEAITPEGILSSVDIYLHTIKIYVLVIYLTIMLLTDSAQDLAIVIILTINIPYNFTVNKFIAIGIFNLTRPLVERIFLLYFIKFLGFPRHLRTLLLIRVYCNYHLKILIFRGRCRRHNHGRVT